MGDVKKGIGDSPMPFLSIKNKKIQIIYEKVPKNS